MTCRSSSDGLPQLDRGLGSASDEHGDRRLECLNVLNYGSKHSVMAMPGYGNYREGPSRLLRYLVGDN
jgi:hypothetical protein